MNHADLPEVVILNDFATPSGGSAVVALQSARGLAARGARVTVFAGAGSADPALAGVPNLTAVCRGGEEIAKDPRRARALVEGLWNRSNARALREVLAGKDPRRTIVHIHSWTKALSASVFAAASGAGFPVALTLHDFFIACPNGGFYVYPAQEVCHRRPLSASCVKCSCDRRNYGHKLWRVARTAIQNQIARTPRRVDHFLGVSHFSLDILRPYLPATTPATVVRNPIHCADLGAAPVGESGSFLFVGRLVPEKGPRLFAEAARRAGVPATIAGDGELRAELERDFPEIRFTGWLDSGGTTRELRAARALVFPSLWYETLGLVAVEAAANGVPVIASAGCAASEYVAPGRTGLHFAHGSVESLTAQIDALTAGAAATLGRAAYDWYWARPWTVDAHVDELLAVYRQMLPA